MQQPVVFVGDDHAIAPIMRDIAQQLTAQGIRVVRGRAEVPPRLTEYAPSEWPALFGEAQAMVISTRTLAPRELLAAAPRLRGVIFPTIGTESVDLADAAQLGLMVAHGPTPENFTGMAESVVMLIGALFLDLPGKEKMTRANAQRTPHKIMRARLVSGSTIGMIGMGRIARAAVDRLAGWGVHVLAYDPYVPQESAPAGVRMVDMPTLLEQSDLISLHVTLTHETRHIIGEEQLRLMKRGAYLVNTSRGGAIDQEALIEALRTGHIGGAALDVFEKEPLAADSPLREMDNVILTSHIVGHVREMHDSFVAAAVENVTRILRGEDPLYVRDKKLVAGWHARISHLHRVGT
jgi:D-3-phosphoglycerate dehydrogenase